MSETAVTSGGGRKKLSFVDVKTLFTAELSEEEALGLIHAFPHIERRERGDHTVLTTADLKAMFDRVYFLMTIGNAVNPTEPSEDVRRAACKILAKIFLDHFSPRVFYHEKEAPMQLLEFYASHEEHCPCGKEHKFVEKFLAGCAERTFYYAVSQKPNFPVELVEQAIFVTQCVNIIGTKKLYRFIPFFYRTQIRALHQGTDRSNTLFTDLELDWSKIPCTHNATDRDRLTKLTAAELMQFKADCRKVMMLCGKIRDEVGPTNQMLMVSDLLARLQWDVAQVRSNA